MRLIDADAFTEYVFDKWIQNNISNGDWTTFREWLNLQETIVEFDGDITKVIVKGVEYFPQKTGKWIHRISPDEYHCGILECPFCGWEEVDTEHLICCARCGTRMVDNE